MDQGWEEGWEGGGLGGRMKMTCCKERVQGIEGCSLRPAAPCVHDYIRGFQSSPPAWISIRVCVLERVRVCVNVREGERGRENLPFSCCHSQLDVTISESQRFSAGKQARWDVSHPQNCETLWRNTPKVSLSSLLLSLSVMSRHLWSCRRSLIRGGRWAAAMCLNMGVFLSLSLSSSDSAGVRPAAIEYKKSNRWLWERAHHRWCPQMPKHELISYLKTAFSSTAVTSGSLLSVSCHVKPNDFIHAPQIGTNLGLGSTVISPWQ